MSIPRQVEENAQAAEDLLERMNSPHSEDEDEDSGEELQAPAANEPDPPAEDDQHTSNDDELTFKERYLTLKGKYDAEVPRLSSELKEFKQAVLDRLGSVDDQEKKEPAAPETEEEDPVIAQFREEFGDDHANLMIRLIEAQSKKVAAESIKSSLTPVEEKVQSVEDKQLANARKDFALDMDTKLGSNQWQDLLQGKDPKFVEFLSEPDPSGLYTYGELIREFANRWDTEKLAKVFKVYENREAPATSPKDKSKPAAPDALIAPSRTTSNNTPSSEEKIIWTGEAVRQFQKDDLAGKFSAEESKRLWDDLLMAPGENRIKK